MARLPDPFPVFGMAIRTPAAIGAPKSASLAYVYVANVATTGSCDDEKDESRELLFATRQLYSREWPRLKKLLGWSRLSQFRGRRSQTSQMGRTQARQRPNRNLLIFLP